MKKEDFAQKDQDLIEKLEFPINNFMQQVINVLKNGVDFNNLNRAIISVTLSVDATGKPVSTVSFQNPLSTKLAGVVCISAVNASSTQRYPSATPFISYSTNGSLITVTNVSGLGIPTGNTNSDKYNLTLEVIGVNLPTA